MRNRRGDSQPHLLTRPPQPHTLHQLSQTTQNTTAVTTPQIATGQFSVGQQLLLSQMILANGNEVQKEKQQGANFCNQFSDEQEDKLSSTFGARTRTTDSRFLVARNTCIYLKEVWNESKSYLASVVPKEKYMCALHASMFPMEILLASVVPMDFLLCLWQPHSDSTC